MKLSENPFSDALKRNINKAILFCLCHNVKILSQGLESIFETVRAFDFDFSVLNNHPTPDQLLVESISPFVYKQVCLKREKTRTKA